jgi:osmotically inducible protein OsmC
MSTLKGSIMTEKKASVHWEGAGKTGIGNISTETGSLKDHPYGFASRFGDDRKGTNPEEILGAAHAACFTMAFAFACEKAGLTTTSIDTTAAVRLVKEGEGFKIDRIALTLKAVVTGLDEQKFQEIAQSAKQNCPLSIALAAVPEITLQATLGK